MSGSSSSEHDPQSVYTRTGDRQEHGSRRPSLSRSRAKPGLARSRYPFWHRAPPNFGVTPIQLFRELPSGFSERL